MTWKFLSLLALAPAVTLAADVEIWGDVSPSPAISPIWTTGTLAVALNADSTGILTIQNSGTVTTDQAIVGAGTNATGYATVTGHGSWDTQTLLIGGAGTGSLFITGNGRVNSGATHIGNLVESSQGLVELRDQGYLSAPILTIGSGTLRLNEEATVVTSSLDAGGGFFVADGTHAALIEVNGGRLQANQIFLGGSGTSAASTYSEGTLKITSGTVSTGMMVSAVSASGTSKSNIEVSGGRLDVGGALTLGAGQLPGQGVSIQTLNLSGSGTVTSTAGSIYSSTGLTTAMEFSGGTWIVSGTLAVGSPAAVGIVYPAGGKTTVTISGSAALQSAAGIIAGYTGSDVRVVMDGGSWAMTNQLQLAGATLELNGGTLASAGGELGAYYSGTGVPVPGTVTVNGGTWANSSRLAIGGTLGGATLQITGGSVSNTDAILHHGSIVQVSGGTWASSGSLSMGYAMPPGDANNSTLQISGGVVTNGNATVGDLLSEGHASASGGVWTTTGSITLGDRGGYGELEISGSAHVTATGGVILSGTTEIGPPLANPPVLVTSTAVLNLNGGELSTLSIRKAGEAGTATFNGTVVRALATNNQFITGFAPGDLTIQAGGAIFDSNGFGISIQSSLTGTGGLVKLGDGRLSLNGNNSYTGGTIIKSGTLQIGDVNALGSTTSRLAIDGGTLDINGRNITVGTLSGSAGAIIRTGATGQYGLTINQVASGTFGGSIQNGVGQIAVTKTGTGTLRVTGSSSYTGGTRLLQGYTEVSGSGVLGNGPVTVSASSSTEPGSFLYFVDTAGAGSNTYYLNGSTETNYLGGGAIFYDTTTAGSARLVANSGTNGGRGGVIAFAGNSSGGTSQIELNGNGRLTISGHNAGTVSIGSLSGGGTVNLGANTLAIGTNNLNTTFAGSISETGSMAKVGTGTLTLSGSSTYSGGTEILAGTLMIADAGPGASALGTGNVLVGESGKLGGIGMVLGDATVAGILAPGNSPGTLSFDGDLLLEDTAVVQMELTSLETDFIVVGGLLTYDGTLSITLSGGFVPMDGAEYQLFDASSVAIGSQFDAITFNNAGYAGEMNYSTGTLTITVVPEPSTLALAGAGVLLVAALRRRR